MYSKKISFIHLFTLTAICLCSALFIAPTTQAVRGQDWQAGNIISDTVFYNGGAMSAGQIQAFLNAKVPVCDTNGTQMIGGETRAQYSAARGYSPPFTCLKDYVQATPSKGAEAGLCNAYGGGTKTSAQIIYDVAQSCRLNPQILLILLQKEQSLVTDTWPWANQYTKATGYACPDSAPCDGAYANFFSQVYYAARQYKLYAKNQTSYSYRAGRVNSILYNPSASCGSSGVYIASQATAGLYIYTPYQPNQAALNNLYGTGDSCSAYGNRNFWRMFHDWFGPTVDNDALFSVTDTNPANGLNIWYFVTPTGRYMIPSLEVYYAWGLNNYTFQPVDASYFNSLPDGGTLGYALRDKFGNHFFMDKGQAHYVRNSAYRSLWGLDGVEAQSTGLVYAKQGGDWAGRFMKDETTNQLWLMDGGRKRLIPTNSPLLYHWGYTPDQLTTVSSAYLNALTDAGTLTRYFVNGDNKYVADSGRFILLGNNDIQTAYNSSGTYFTLNNTVTSSFLPVVGSDIFIEDAGGTGWYMIASGKKHYIPDLQTALNWGYRQGAPLLRMSSEYMSTLSNGGTLTSVVQDESGAVWALDGQKHRVSDDAEAEWVADGQTLPTVSNQGLSMVATGSGVNRFIQTNGTPFAYVMTGGTKHYLQGSAKQGWNATSLAGLNSSLINRIPEGRFTNQVVRSQAGTNYVLDGTVAYPINAALASNWEDGTAPVVISDATLANYTISPSTLGLYFMHNGSMYLASGGRALPLWYHGDAYSAPGSVPTLGANPLPVGDQVSYIVKSTNPAVTTMWLINGGAKIAFPSFAEAANYGFISQSRPVTALTPSVLSAITTSSNVPSLLIRKEGAGVKLISFGYALGFPDGDTINRFTSASNPILTVPASVYDSFILRRTASRIIRDDANNHYLMENGTKRRIANQSLLSTTYGGIPVVYLEGTTMVAIPNGADIN